MNEVIRIVKEWFSRDHTRLALGIGIFSAGLTGYSLGILRDQAVARVPLTMNIVAPQAAQVEIPVVLGDAITKKTGVSENASTGCAFVGSRNSNLYHLPSCAPAKRIKEANRVCFASKEAAIAKGYQSGCLK